MSRLNKPLGFYARIVLLIGVLSWTSVPVTSQFSNGATTESCVTLLQPGIDPQPSESSPFSIVTSPTLYTPGVTMRVLLISTPQGTTFEGALIQARNVGSTVPIGSYGIPSFNLTGYLDCGGSPNGTVTNTNNSTKTPPIFFTWTSSESQVGDIELIFVIESTPGIYWIERLIVSSIPLPFCSTRPCQNGGTCVENPDDFSCLCPSNYTGTTCETLLLEFANINGGVFDIADYSSVAGSTSYIFINVPTDSILDVYSGERVDYQIGNGNIVGVNEFIPGQQGIGNTRISGEAFWVQANINDANLRFPELRIVIYQFYIAPAVQPEIPAELSNFEGIFYIVERLPEGANIVTVSGVDAGSFRFGIGRNAGENEVARGEFSLRTTEYEPYIWISLIGPVPNFAINNLLCPVDPCEEVGACSLGFCVPNPRKCSAYTCTKVTSTPCAACGVVSPCLNKGVCEYDTIRRRSFTCICSRPWTGRTCQDWRFRDLVPGEEFNMLPTSFPLFLPFYRNFYTIFTVSVNDRQVRILEVEGFLARFGTGPAIKHHTLDTSVQQFALTGTNQFWMLLSPNGLDQVLRLLII